MDAARRVTVAVVAVALLTGPGCTEGESTEAFCRRLAEPRPGDRWGETDLIVFVGPDATDRQIDALRGLLDRSADVAGYTWHDQDDTYAEFVELFADTPEMVDAVSPEIMTQSARVQTTDRGPESVGRVGEQFENLAGVYRVVVAGDVPRSVIDGSVRPLTSEFGASSSAFTRGRSGVRLSEVAPRPMRDHARILEELWATPGEADGDDLERVVEAARQVAAFYDTECR